MVRRADTNPLYQNLIYCYTHSESIIERNIDSGPTGAILSRVLFRIRLIISPGHPRELVKSKLYVGLIRKDILMVLTNIDSDYIETFRSLMTVKSRYRIMISPMSREPPFPLPQIIARVYALLDRRRQSKLAPVPSSA